MASGCPEEGKTLISEDLRFIEKFTGEKMDPDLHCPVRYRNPLAPCTAARLEDRPFSLEAVMRSLSELKKRYPVLVVEGIGGVMVPLDRDTLVIDMMAFMGFPVLVVARPGLGTINHTLLTLRALQEKDLPILGFITNGRRDKDDHAAMTGPSVISEYSGVPFLGHVPFHDPREMDLDAFVDRVAPFLRDLVPCASRRHGDGAGEG